jgi:phosphoserine phosphatase RsbU/P
MAIPSNLNARLIVDMGGRRRVVPIASLPFTIGRGADRDLCVAQAQVSREHACIERDAGGYVIRDLGSRHGTFVNGAKITTMRLGTDDSITLGNSRDLLVFEDDDESDARTLIAQISQSGVGSAGQTDLEKLALFLKAAQSLNTVGAIRDVLRTMLEYAIRLTGAERGFVFLGESAEAFSLECGQDREGRPIAGQPSISYSVVRDVARSQLDYFISDAVEEIAEASESIVLNAIGSLVAIPLRCEGSTRLLGLLYLDSRSRSHDFNRTGKEILHAIARQAAILIENVRLLQMEREAALVRRELEIAAAIQQQIIPQTLPEFGFARVSARTVPCTGIGGDFYDVIPVHDGFFAILADVSGKGVPAALLASMVQGMFHGQVNVQTAMGASITEAVQSANTFVCARAPDERYLTLAALRYIHSDAGDAQIELVNGGHVSPLIVRADGCIETISEGDMPVGLLAFARFHSIRLTLAVGDRIVLLSDGITEAEDPDGTQFGFERLEVHLTAPNPVGALFAATEQFGQGTHQQDDQTVLVIERTA